MEGPRQCYKDEFCKTLKLVNDVFRPQPEFNPTMREEFPLLFSEDNLKHIRIIAYKGVPVASVGFLNSTILIEGTPVRAASVGAVCTHSGFRGLGLSSKILDDAEDIMKEEETDIMLVSGRRNLYLRRGCTMTGTSYEFDVSKNNSSFIDLDDIRIQAVDSSNFNQIMEIYNSEATRYYRSEYEFHKLFEGGTTEFGKNTYMSYVIMEKDNCAAYIVLKIIGGDISFGEVKEYAGNRECVFKAICMLLEKENLQYIRIKCTENDPLKSILTNSGIEYKLGYLPGTIKIINYEKLMKSLMPYFRQYAAKEIMDKIKFKEYMRKYIMIIENESIELENMNSLVSIIFGSKVDMNVDFKGKPKLESFIKSVFPIPFVWTENLNFQ